MIDSPLRQSTLRFPRLKIHHPLYLILFLTLFSRPVLSLSTAEKWTRRLRLSSNQNSLLENKLFNSNSHHLITKRSFTGSEAAPSCKDPGIPADGVRIGSVFYVGSVLLFACNPGFVLRGSEVLTCRYGAQNELYWDAYLPQCVAQAPIHDSGPPDPCGSPPEPSTFAYRVSYSPGNSVGYSCIDDYIRLIGSVQLSCKDGAWQGELLQCRRIGQCRDYRSIENGRRILEGTRENDTVAFVCNEGFVLLGNRQVQCGSDGYWKGAWPQCTKAPANCGDPGTLVNGRRFVGGTTEGSLVKFLCNSGYALFGDSGRTCLHTGEWSGSVPSCRRVSCTSPPRPLDGQVSFESTEYGAQATYSCNQGHVLSGSSDTTCGAAGRWTNPPPKCTRVECGGLRAPLHGQVRVRERMYSFTANYSCSHGYGLVGFPSRTCQSDGRWSGSAPSCDSDTCGTLSDPVNGKVTMTRMTRGGVAIYSCDSGYKPSDPMRVQRTCGLFGVWSGTAPTCKAITCPDLREPQYASISMTNQNLYASIAEYTCDFGFVMIGGESSVSRHCQSSGIWTGRPTYCYEVRCSELNSPHNGNVVLSGRGLAEEATYSCDFGYELMFGDEIRSCMETGLWSGSEPCCIRMEIFCEELSNPDDGTVVLTGVQVGDRADYQCDEGLDLVDGEQTRTCLPSGLWSGSEPLCTVTCPMLNNLVNGTVTLTGNRPGDKAVYTCDAGFDLLQSEDCRICGENGVWSGNASTCRPIPLTPRNCGNLSSPKNGQVDTSLGLLAGAIATYSCEVGYILNGVANRTCDTGMDGKWSGSAPTCLPVDCGELSSPVDGGISYSDGTTLGSTATYSCNEGYLISGAKSRVCEASGVWSGVEPVCTVRDCGSLIPITDGTVLVNSTTVGSIAEFECDFGYELIGSDSRECMSDGTWSNEQPSCIFVDCGSLNPPANGNVMLTETTFGSEANYTCDTNFKLVGPEDRECMEDGSWSDTEPTCELLRCPELLSPVNGLVLVLNTTVGSVATYSCSERYRLVGAVEIVCLSNEMWSVTSPSCQLITCPVLSPIENGVVDILDNTPDGRAIYGCDRGLALSGNSARVCGADGEWLGQPPVCEVVFCPELTPPTNGRVIVNARTVGSTVSYLCDTGYVVRGLLVRVCGDDGQWVGDEPICVRPTCDPADLSNPSNGMVSFSSVNLDSIATYTCNSGYRLIGNPTRQCVVFFGDNVWSGPAPICEQIVCPTLESPVNGIVLVSFSTFGGGATYLCNPGFVQLTGFYRRTCRENGQWDGVEPTCQPFPDTVVCPTLSNPENGTIQIATSTVGSTVSYTCDIGYNLGGSTMRTCLNDGSWTGTEPVCTRIDCGTLEDPPNGAVTTLGGTTFSQLARYFCSEGYQLRGLDIRICQENNQWSGSAPTCDLIDCGSLSNPVNGMVDTPGGTTFGQEARYSCVDDYEINGSPTRVCTLVGVWSNTEPSCNRFGMLPDSCGDPGTLENGDRSLTSTTTGSVVEYSCSEGYRLSGNANRTCMDNKQWSGEVPTCVLVMCPPLADPHNGIKFVGGFTVGSTVTYICNQGFTVRHGDVILRRCLPSGQWSDEEPLCISDSSFECMSLDAITNGTVAIDTLLVGSMANYSCSPGFVINGPTSRICEPGGMWSGLEPSCQRIQCPDPGTPANGRQVMNNFIAGSSVYFVCHDGFETQDEIVLRCLEDGTWSSPTPTCAAVSSACSGSGEVMDSFGHRCQCTNGQLESCCRYRQDWSTLSSAEKSRYINAVKTVASMQKFRPLYNEIIRRYKDSFNTIAQYNIPTASHFFPWHRYFMLEYEDLLRMVDRNITIPYWDWSVNSTMPYKSPVFDPDTGFGNSADDTSLCITSGPFREGEFVVTPSASNTCLMRQYNDFQYPSRALIENEFLSLEADKFDQFHNSIQLFINLNIRCFVGGHMCTRDAANDPLYLLQLSRIDLILDRWQKMDTARATARFADNTEPLVLTFDDSLTVSDFSNNTNLPYGVCVKYAPLQEPPDLDTTTIVPSSGPDLPRLPAADPGIMEPPRQRSPEVDCISNSQIENDAGLTEEAKDTLRELCGYLSGSSG